MTRSNTSKNITFPPSALLALALLGLALGACASAPATHADLKPAPVLPTEQYALTAQTMNRPINLRINPNGLSDNQRLALDQVASHASWLSGEPVNVQIVTNGDPNAVNAGRAVGSYLMDRDVDTDKLSQVSSQDQPADIVTVNLTSYRARTYDCGAHWEDLAKTATNQPMDNFGCAVTSNLAAQIADPRDLVQPAPATSTDVARKSIILGKYRAGEVTSSAVDNTSSGTISDAIK